MRDDYIIYDGELYHYGRKGMKWGQHIFGKVKESLGRRAARRKELKERERLRKTPLRKLTSEEIKRRSELLDEEKMIRQKERDIKSLNPEQVAAGKKFLINAGQKVLGPALADAGKEALTKFLKGKMSDALGVGEKDIDEAMKALKKEAEEWGYRRTIAEAKAAKDRAEKGSGEDAETERLATEAKRWGYKKTIAEAKAATEKGSGEDSEMERLATEAKRWGYEKTIAEGKSKKDAYEREQQKNNDKNRSSSNESLKEFEEHHSAQIEAGKAWISQFDEWYNND